MHPASGRQVLIRSRREVQPGGLVEHLLRHECLATTDDPVEPTSTIATASRNGWCGSRELRVVAEPADERLRIPDSARTSTRPESASRADALPACGRSATLVVGRRFHLGFATRVEADLADVGRRRVDVRWTLPPGRSGLTEMLRPRREEELAQVDVPVAVARPADVLARRSPSPRSRPPGRCARSRSDPRARTRAAPFGVARCTGPPSMANTRCVRFGGAPASGPIVAHRDVDAVVVDRALLRIRAWVEERSANRVLPVLRLDRPARGTCRCRPGRGRASPGSSAALRLTMAPVPRRETPTGDSNTVIVLASERDRYAVTWLSTTSQAFWRIGRAARTLRRRARDGEALTQFRTAGTTFQAAQSVDVYVRASSYAARYSTKRRAARGRLAETSNASPGDRSAPGRTLQLTET